MGSQQQKIGSWIQSCLVNIEPFSIETPQYMVEIFGDQSLPLKFCSANTETRHPDYGHLTMGQNWQYMHLRLAILNTVLPRKVQIGKTRITK